MSHLILRKIGGKWRTYDKNKSSFEGPTFTEYAAGRSYQEARDAKEDKAMGGGMEKTMGEFKAGVLHSGSKNGPMVKSRKQAIAIGMNS